MRKTILIGAMAIVYVTVPASAWADPAPNDSNCAGVFASTSASGSIISGLATSSTGVSEFVRPDANCGEN